MAKFIWMPYVEELKNQPELPEPEIVIFYEEKYPLEKALTNTQSLFRWTVDIHNEVNQDSN